MAYDVGDEQMEAKATCICTYQAQLVYGLLQTEQYARAVLATGMPDNLDDLVAAHMERQRLLKGRQPPLTLVVLDEAALHRPIGGRGTMRNQLAHLLSLGDKRWLSMQVLPFGAGEHAGLVGSFYASLQAAALSVKDSAALIARVMEECSGEQQGPDQHGVA
jgi:hypothetical protein